MSIPVKNLKKFTTVRDVRALADNCASLLVDINSFLNPIIIDGHDRAKLDNLLHTDDSMLQPMRSGQGGPYEPTPAAALRPFYHKIVQTLDYKTDFYLLYLNGLQSPVNYGTTMFNRITSLYLSFWNFVAGGQLMLIEGCPQTFGMEAIAREFENDALHVRGVCCIPTCDTMDILDIDGLSAGHRRRSRQVAAILQPFKNLYNVIFRGPLTREDGEQIAEDIREAYSEVNRTGAIIRNTTYIMQVALHSFAHDFQHLRDYVARDEDDVGRLMTLRDRRMNIELALREVRTCIAAGGQGWLPNEIMNANLYEKTVTMMLRQSTLLNYTIAGLTWPFEYSDLLVISKVSILRMNDCLVYHVRLPIVHLPVQSSQFYLQSYMSIPLPVKGNLHGMYFLPTHHLVVRRDGGSYVPIWAEDRDEYLETHCRPLHRSYICRRMGLEHRLTNLDTKEKSGCLADVARQNLKGCREYFRAFNMTHAFVRRLADEHQWIVVPPSGGEISNKLQVIILCDRSIRSTNVEIRAPTVFSVSPGERCQVDVADIRFRVGTASEVANDLRGEHFSVISVPLPPLDDDWTADINTNPMAINFTNNYAWNMRNHYVDQALEHARSELMKNGNKIDAHYHPAPPLNLTRFFDGLGSFSPIAYLKKPLHRVFSGLIAIVLALSALLLLSVLPPTILVRRLLRKRRVLQRRKLIKKAMARRECEISLQE